MSDDIREHTRRLAGDLETAGHTEHAQKLHQTLADHPLESGFLHALRGVCDTLLTVVEAIDPVSEITLEELRRKIDAKLTP